MATLKLGTQSVNDIKKGTTNIPSAYLGGYRFSFSSGDTPPAPHDYSQDYLTFRALEDGTFKFSGNSINYSLDDGATWTELASDTDTPTVNSGNTILWKASLTAGSNGIGRFSSSGRFEVEGNTMSLKYGDNFSGQTTLSDRNSLAYLFSGCTSLTSVENMVLPATTLVYQCYLKMFSFCTSLTSAPSLLATTLAFACYQYMFSYCTSLTTAPSLPATTLVERCYNNMFYYCTSLNSITCLATSIPNTNCTYNWVNAVAASGTFTKAASMTSWGSGNNGIPNNWTVQDYSS